MLFLFILALFAVFLPSHVSDIFLLVLARLSFHMIDFYRFPVKPSILNVIL